MGTRMVRLTVLFEPPFWIGLCEREEDGQYAVCRIVFGAEPREQEVYAFVLANWHRLRFSPALAAETTAERHRNPKRVQREIRRAGARAPARAGQGCAPGADPCRAGV